MKDFCMSIWHYLAEAFNWVILVIATPIVLVANAITDLVGHSPDTSLKISGVFVLVILDTLSGLALAVKHKKVSSFKFSAVVQKIIAYTIALLAALVLRSCTETHFILDVAVYSIMLTEILSIIENTDEFVHWIGKPRETLRSFFGEKIQRNNGLHRVIGDDNRAIGDKEPINEEEK